MFPLNVSETGTDLISTLLPLLICCMLPSLFRGGGDRTAGEAKPEVDSWFTSYGISEAYEAIVKETDQWREKVETEVPTGIGAKIRNTLRRSKVERFNIKQSIPPRLYSLLDPQEGVVTFEFTEIEGGGTSLKVTYSGPKVRRRVQTFKAQMPVSVTVAGRGDFCPHCGKSVLTDYKNCPYCGQILG